MKRVFSSRDPFEDRPLTEQVKALRSLITDETGEIRPLITRMARAAARDFFEEIREGFRLRMEQDPDFVAWQQSRNEEQMAQLAEARKQVAEMRELEDRQLDSAIVGHLVIWGPTTLDDLELDFTSRDRAELNVAMNRLIERGSAVRRGDVYEYRGIHEGSDPQ